MLRELVKGSLALGFSSFVVLGFAALYDPYLARVLPKSAYGAYTLALASVSWLMVLAAVSLDSTPTKLLPERMAAGQSLAPVVRSAYLLSLLSGSLIAAVFFLGSGVLAWQVYKDPPLEPVLRLVAPLIALSGLFTVTLGLLRGLKEFRRFALYESLRVAIMMAVGVALVSAGFNLTGVFIALYLAYGVPALFGFLRLRRSVGPGEGRWELRPLLRLGFWFMVVSVSIQALNLSHQFFLGVYESLETVANYGPPVRLLSLISVFSLAIRQSMFPFISESHAKGDQAEVRRYMDGAVRYSLAAIGLLMILAMALRRELILGLYGHRFAPSIPLLELVLLALPWATLAMLSNNFLLATGENRKMLPPLLAAGAVVAALSPILIPRFHAEGAALAYVAGYCVFGAGFFGFVLRKTGGLPGNVVGLLGVIFALTGANALMAGSALWLDLVMAAATGGLFVLLLLRAGFFTREEIAFAKSQLLTFGFLRAGRA